MTLILLLLLAATPVVEDSPLVAAAKRSMRHVRKSRIVITHENLVRGTGARITTTESQPPLGAAAPPPAPTPEMVHAQRRAETAAAHAAAQREQARLRAKAEADVAKKAVAAEDGYDGGQGDDADELVVQPESPPPL